MPAKNIKLLPDQDPKETFGSCELSLYAAQDAEVFERFVEPSVNRLAKRLLLGSYTADLAQASFYPAVTFAALKYEEEFGDKEAAKNKVITCFDYEDRKDAALLLLYAHIDLIKERAGLPTSGPNSGIPKS